MGMQDEPQEISPTLRTMETLEQLKQVSTKGTEYWMARDLQPLLGYTQWRRFVDAINRAKQACLSSGLLPENHFAEVGKLVDVGSGARRERSDIALTRYAAYLVAMNGDPNKSEVASAQTYFAVQTRQHEIANRMAEEEKRLALRERVKIDNTHLAGAAKASGVTRFGLFNDIGYRGLYGGLGVKQIKQVKGIEEKDDLLDRAGRAELAANDFRITQTEEALRKNSIHSEDEAFTTHQRVGETVRDSISEIGGTMPEDLPAEQNIRKLRASQKKNELPPP